MCVCVVVLLVDRVRVVKGLEWLYAAEWRGIDQTGSGSDLAANNTGEARTGWLFWFFGDAGEGEGRD